MPDITHMQREREKIRLEVPVVADRWVEIEIPRPHPAAIVYAMAPVPATRDPRFGPGEVRQGDVTFLRSDVDEAGELPSYSIDLTSLPAKDDTVSYMPRHCRRCERVFTWYFVPPLPSERVSRVSMSTRAFCLGCYEALATQGGDEFRSEASRRPDG